MASNDFMREKTVKYENYILEYYNNNAEKLRRVVDKILKSFDWYTDKSHFYSLANEIFVAEILSKYDGERNFDAFVKVCLSNKIRTEITHMNRDKRMPYLRDKNGDKVIDDNGKYVRIPIISLDMPIMEDGEEQTSYLDILDAGVSVEDQVIEGKGEDSQLEKYMSRLSKKQQRILRLLSEGFTPGEIQEKLHIKKSEYSDCMSGIHSHENIKILFGR